MNAEMQKSVLAATGRFVRKLLDPVEERIKALEGRIVEKGDKGEDGKNGADGKDGQDGKSLTPEDIQPIIELAVSKALLDLERRGTDLIQRAIDKIPAPQNGKDGRDGQDGKDGQDGLGFEDMNLEYDGRRSFVLRYERGDSVKEISVDLPVVLDAGFYGDGKTYAPGDAVTHGGSMWIAQKETSSRPAVGNEDWRLAVKKGRDGKAGDKGDRGEKGMDGKDGRLY